MPPVHNDPALEPRLGRKLWIWGFVTVGSGLIGGLLFAWAGQERPGGGVPLAHLLTLGAWAALAFVFAWQRWQPRKAYDRAAVRTRAEAFQAKRWIWLVAASAFIALFLVPMAVWEAVQHDLGDTPIDRLFKATLFLGPCALTLGMMTTAIYSRQWGAVVDDELTAVHRASAFGLGFVALMAVGAAAYVTALLRPEWALAALPPVIGAPVVVAALRFALLERAASLGG